MIGCGNSKEQKKELTVKAETETPAIIADNNTDTIFNFEFSENFASDWSQYYTGKDGESPNWQIIDDNGNKVLAQLSSDNPNYHFNDIVFNNLRLKNMELNVKMKGVDGRMDQGGGFIWRFTDADNYYVVRANPLEDNVVLYKVENGRRTDLAVVGKGRTYGVDVKPLGNNWNNLRLTVVDNLFTVFLNNEQLFQVEDNTFSKAGKVGLWTKADAVTYFDEFKVKSIN
ncbi:MAG: hypothetical protein B6I18_06400 [Bacteroidetes bacterium 4572_112]|nr:MAG: hypothetical protein B6I18_06400 [Bacteroidetes bacterium 4572_112]